MYIYVFKYINTIQQTKCFYVMYVVYTMSRKPTFKANISCINIHHSLACLRIRNNIYSEFI